MGGKIRVEMETFLLEFDDEDGASLSGTKPAPKKPAPEPLPPVADLISAMGAGITMMAVPIAVFAYVLDRVHNHGGHMSLVALLVLTILFLILEAISAFSTAWAAVKLYAHIFPKRSEIGDVARFTIGGGVLLLACWLMYGVAPDLVKDPKAQPQADVASAMQH